MWEHWNLRSFNQEGFIKAIPHCSDTFLPQSTYKQMLKLTRLLGYKYWKMTNISPPESVRGMTILDRSKFTKKIKVPFIQISNDKINEILKLIKPYLLKMINLKPVQIINNEGILILDPIKYEEIKEKYNIEFKEIEINYDNFKSDEILKAIINEDNVTSYSLIGHIVHLNLRPNLYKYKKIIGQVLLDKVPKTRTVVTKIDSITNEFRNFNMEILAGDNDFVARVKENKCIFELDFSQVYWNPRLCTEHCLIVENIQKGDVLFDIFAGIGPFSIPASKKGAIVYANDLNTHSIKWLNQNKKLNKINNLTIFNKDASLFIKEDFKNIYFNLKKGDYNIFITMNLPGLAVNFLKYFINLYNESIDLPIPIVFLYLFTKNEENPKEKAKKMVLEEINVEIDEVFFVRNVAPNKDMYRVKFKLTHDILINKKRTNDDILKCREEYEEKKWKKSFQS